jgi:hypothetical protein
MPNTHSISLVRASSQYLSINDTATLSITGDITIQFWVKLTQLPSTVSDPFGLVYKGIQNTNQLSYWSTIGAANGISFGYSDDGTVVVAHLTGGSVAGFFVVGDVGVWRHVAITADVSEKIITFYKDAVAQTTSYDWNSATAIYNGTAPLLIGAEEWATTPENFFDGLIDDVRIYNIARTPAQIVNDYQQELTDLTDVVAYWKLNNSLLDETANNNDLTNNGTATFSTDAPPSVYTLPVSVGEFILTGISTITELHWDLQDKNTTSWSYQSKS